MSNLEINEIDAGILDSMLTSMIAKYCIDAETSTWINTITEIFSEHGITGKRIFLDLKYIHRKHEYNVDALLDLCSDALIEELKSSWINIEEDQYSLVDRIITEIRDRIIGIDWVKGKKFGIFPSGILPTNAEDTVLVYGVKGKCKYDSIYPRWIPFQPLRRNFYRLRIEIDIFGFRFNEKTYTISQSNSKSLIIIPKLRSDYVISRYPGFRILTINP